MPGHGMLPAGSAVIATTSCSDSEDGGGHKKDSKKPDSCVCVQVTSLHFFLIGS